MQVLFGVVRCPDQFSPIYRGIARPPPPPPHDGCDESHPYAAGWVAIASEIESHPGFTRDESFARRFFGCVEAWFDAREYELIASTDRADAVADLSLLGYDIAFDDAASLCQDFLLKSALYLRRFRGIEPGTRTGRSVCEFVQTHRAKINSNGLFASPLAAQECLEDARRVFDDVDDHTVQSIWLIAGECGCSGSP